MERPIWRSQDVFIISRCCGNRRRSNWIRLEKFPRIFDIVCSSRDPGKAWERTTSKQRISGTGSSSFQCSVTFCGNQMIRIASRTLRKSRITRSNSYQDIGLFLVQGRKGDDMATLTVDSGTVQPTKWYNSSKKLVIVSSQVPVLWVAGSWSREKAKVPFISMEIRWIRNSCFKQFIPWINKYLRGCHGLVLSIRFDKWRKRISRCPRAHWNFGHGGNRRSENVGVSTEPGIWKQDARKRKLPNIGKEGTNDTIMWKSLIPASCDSRNLLPNSTWCERARDFSDEVWSQKIFEGSTKKRIEYCKDRDEHFCYLRAFQGHSDGIPIEPELMGYAFLLRNRKRCIFHRTFIELPVCIGNWIDSGRKGEEIKPVRQPTNPFGNDPEEEPHDDHTGPQKVL